MKILLWKNGDPLCQEMERILSQQGVTFCQEPRDCQAVLWFAQGERDFVGRAEKLCGQLCDQSVLILLPYALWEASHARERAEGAAICTAAGALSQAYARSGLRINCLRYGAWQGETVSDWVALGRNARPEEIARAALFFAGEGTAFMTGQIIDVNGGKIH